MIILSDWFGNANRYAVVKYSLYLLWQRCVVLHAMPPPIPISLCYSFDVAIGRRQKCDSFCLLSGHIVVEFSKLLLSNYNSDFYFFRCSVCLSARRVLHSEELILWK